jgi:hypothetical protein
MGRAYVPGHEHDLFLSYAHDEAEWVGAFRQSLDKAIRTRLGRPASWWQDVSDLRGGQLWRKEIGDAIQEAVAFLAICSPTYLERPYCQQECETLRANLGAATDPSKLEDRLLKVIKTPSVDNAHLDFFHELQHGIEFFNKAGDEYATSSHDFEFQITQAARWIAEILQRKRNAKTPVYVAQCAADMADDRTALAKQLEVYGYNVTTVYSTMGGTRLIDNIDRAEWSVFLIGDVYDAYAERQLRQAIDLGKPVACWIHPVRAKSAGPQQQEFIKLVHSIPTRHELFGHASIRGVIEELRRLLNPTKEPEPLTSASARYGNVFLLYDSADSKVAGEIRNVIRDQDMAVFTPTPDPSTHRQLMTECDGVLLYRGAAAQPDNWLLQSFPHVYCADQFYPERRHPLKARTFFLADPSPLAQYPGVEIIPFTGEVKPEALKPFFDRMQGSVARSADAGR